MEGDNAVKAAAVVAYTFHMDPVQVLDGSYFDYALRVAAKNYVSKQIQKERDKANRKK